jgi:hypothetical protein
MNRPTLPPGLHVHEIRRTLPPPPADGVPLIVGFGAGAGSLRTGVVDIDRWEQFQASIAVDDDGYLGPAVRGFFLNGGRRCMVLPVPTADPMQLAGPFRGGGPLEDLTDIDLVCVPDAAGAPAVQAAVLEHCEAMGNRFAILDSPRPVRTETTLPRSRFGALYRPWIGVARDGEAGFMPPCGHVAGLYARTDARYGVHRAPANDVLEGVLELDWHMDERQHAALNDSGVNCIVGARGRGIRVMGARALSRESAWDYVPVTRLFIALARWLETSLDDLIFEAHTPELWQRVERRIRGRCLELMNAGALAAADPASAFRVKCDAETNPAAVRDAGRLVAEVGLAPSVPAEFVVVRVTHDASGITFTGP